MANLAPFFPPSASFSSSSHLRQLPLSYSLHCYIYACCHRRHSLPYQPLYLFENNSLGYHCCERCLKVASRHSGAYSVRANMDDGCSSTVLTKPADVVREFYASVNRRKLEDVSEVIAENCVYEDFVYPKPFVGRQAVLAFFKKFMDSLSQDLQFVIDDISKDDSAVVAVAWHLAWRGRSFPFSKGCSFYRCDIFDGKIQIVYGRDSVEPAVKPGDFALVAVRAVTALLERFPWLVER